MLESLSTIPTRMEKFTGRAASRLACVANHVNGNNKNIGKATATMSQHSPQSHPISPKSYAAGSSCPELAEGVLRLYSMRFCPYAQRTRLVLEHKKIPYETVNVHLRNKPDWLLEKNPFGLVPILEKDGQIIYESTSTCEWLDEVYPDHPPKLMPDDPYKKAWDRTLFENFGTLTARFRRILFKPETKAEALPKLHKNLKYYEDALKQRGGPFFGGPEPSMLDFYLWPHMERVPAMATVDPIIAISGREFPQLQAWFDAMYQLPAVKATMFDIPTHLQFMKTLGQGNADYDYGL